MAKTTPVKKPKMIHTEPKKSVSLPATPVSKPIKVEKKPIISKPLPDKSSSPDRRIGQKIGMRLRNLLKLPKAHKWVCYEWFYSTIDK